MSDQVRSFARGDQEVYFVRGGVSPAHRDVGGETDFGPGIYAWDGDPEGIARATEWAKRKARYQPGLLEPRLYLFTVTKEVLNSWQVRRLRTTAGKFDFDDWHQAVRWYRARDPGPGPLDDFDLVSDPLAVGKRPYRPKLDVPDQYRFHFRVQRQIRVVAEDQL